ncbi:MAG TPA: hypothetical protein VEW66_08735 [Thermomicrobiales bacterium]|nr:hypothetical protein [Thermomicrobiales bacterium]
MPPTPANMETLVLVTRTVDDQTWIHTQRLGDSVQQLAAIAVRSPSPQLPVTSGSIGHLRALDVLEAVLDEEAWIAAIADALAPSATATFRVPLEGPVAWLDALNLYRYAQDVIGVGKHLKETQLKGWHRHYRTAELTELLSRHGLQVIATEREGNPLLEATQFAGLVWGGMIRHSSSTEERLRAWRERKEDLSRLVHLGPLSTRVTMTVRKVA